MRVDELAENLTTALRALPSRIRPNESDIAAIALLVAEHPAMGRWEVRERGVDWRDLKT
jgi:hypothetical protein